MTQPDNLPCVSCDHFNLQCGYYFSINIHKLSTLYSYILSIILLYILSIYILSIKIYLPESGSKQLKSRKIATKEHLHDFVKMISWLLMPSTLNQCRAHISPLISSYRENYNTKCLYARQPCKKYHESYTLGSFFRRSLPCISTSSPSAYFRNLISRAI